MAPCFDDCGCNKRIYIVQQQPPANYPEYVEYIDDGDAAGAAPADDGDIVTAPADDGIGARSAGGRRIIRRRVRRVRRPTGFRRGVVGKRVVQGRSAARVVQRRIIHRQPAVRQILSASEDSESPNLFAL